MKFRFIHAERARYPVRVLCRVLEVSRSGFYAWCRRAPAQRVQAEQRLTQAIQAAHRRSRGTYGSPRIHAELKAQGLPVSRKRVARLMRDCGLRGVRPHRRRRTTLVD
jgi:putative transposase